MQKWEALVESYPAAPTLRDFFRAVEAAEVLKKEDLTPFELDWFLQTLFTSPVHLISTIRTKYSDNGWAAINGRCFVMLEDMGDKIQSYHEDIVELCLLPYSAATRKRALQLARALTVHVVDMTAARAHAVALLQCAEQPATVRAEAAHLIGTISAHHPESLVNDEEKEIWRTYLCVLEATKTSDSLTNGVLLGLNGLFLHFGMHLSTSELNSFYDNLSNKYLHLHCCIDACLQILSNHARLFPEKLALDVRLRSQLWSFVGTPHASDALKSVYKNATSESNVQNIVTTEIYPNTKSKKAQVKNIAFSILSSLLHSYRRQLEDISRLFDEQVSTLCSELDFGLASKLDTATDVDIPKWEYDGDLINLVTQAAWCIESNIPNCDSLLSAIIMLYDKVPTVQRKKLVIHTILKADRELRSNAMAFLITESCRFDENTQMSNISKYMPVWVQLFDSQKGKDEIVLDHSKAVFDDFVNYVLFALDEYLENSDTGFEQSNLPSLLLLTSQIIQLENAKDYAVGCLEMTLNLLLDCEATCEGLVLLVMNLVQIADENCMFENDALSQATVGRLSGFYQQICLSSCNSEAYLCAACLAVAMAPEVVGDCGAIYALQIIFSRNDVESKTLSKALRKLETVINSDDLDNDTNIVSDIVSRLQRLRAHNDTSDRDARILHRDLSIFSGKYGYKSDVNYNSVETMLIVQLKDVLVLNVSSSNEDNTIKLNLSSLLDLALYHEDPKALHSLLLILCKNLSNRKERVLQTALISVIKKLSHCHVRREAFDIDSLNSAILFCDSQDNVKCLIKYITTEKSPGVRKILSNLLEALLLKDPHSETTENLLRIVIEDSCLMMSSQNSVTKMGGLDLVETIVSAFVDNNTLTKEFLPDLLVKILKTNEKYAEIAYEIASKYLVENQALFSKEAIEILMKITFETIVNDIDITKLRSIARLTINTMKSVSTDNEIIVNIILNTKNMEKNPLKYLLLLSEANKVFAFNIELKRKIVTFNNFKMYAMLKDLLKMSNNNILEYLILEVTYLVLSEYADALLEIKYMLTIEYLSTAITKTDALMVKKLHKPMEKCLKSFQKIWRNIPQAITNAFVSWCKKLPLEHFTKQLEQKIFPPEHAVFITAFKKMLAIFNIQNVKIILNEMSDFVTQWPKIVLQIYGLHSGIDFLKTKMAYVTEVLAVTFNFLKPEDVKGIVLECQKLQGVSNEKIGLKFCRTFIKCYGPYLLENEILLDNDVKPCCILVHDLIKYYGRLKCSEDISNNITKLLDKLWPTLEKHHTATELSNILKDLAFIEPKGLPLTTNPGQWLLKRITETQHEDVVKFVSVLPVFLKCGVDDEVRNLFNASISSYSLLLRRGVSSSALATLGALCRTSELTVLELVANIAADDTNSAWDAILESCASLLSHTHTLRSIYMYCDVSLAVFNKLLVPAVRHASTAACEEFFAGIMSTVLSDLWRRGRTTHKAFLVQYTKAFTLAQLTFEKLPMSTLESSTSPLYSQIDLKRSRNLAQELCKLCVTLRSEVLLPDDATEDLNKCYRVFQQANFNCLAAVLCKTRPNAKFFAHLFHNDVWNKIIDCNETWIVYIQPLGRHQSTRRHVVSTASTEGDSSLTLFTRQTGTFYTSTRLLSDNPKAYALSEELQPTEPLQSICLQDNVINGHPCAGVTAALALVSSSTLLSDWLKGGLKGDRNVSWFLAQMIINCKEDLKSSAPTLIPDLLRVAAATPYEIDGQKILNGLHVEILNTIVFWSEEAKILHDMSDEDECNLNTAIELVVHSSVHHKQRAYLHKALVKTLNDVLKVYWNFVKVNWKIFEHYLKDVTNEPLCLDLLITFSKNKIYIPELVSTVLAKFDTRQILAKKLSSMAELLGLALSACRDSPSDNLSKFWKILDRLRVNNCQDYVKVLFYVQNGFRECCNEINFRHIADLAPKMIREQKSKCYEIISTYITFASPSRYITDMFDNIDICESVVGDHTTMGLKVVKHGLRLMEEGLKRRVVFLASEFCNHSVDKIRKLAYEVLLQAFEGVVSDNESAPLPKRPKTETSSKILQLLHKEDVYIKTITARLGEGVIDKNKDISDAVQQGLHPFLAQHISVRYCECLLICMYAPAVFSSSCSTSSASRASILSALTRLLFQVHRNHLKKTLLSDTPLTVTGATGSSKLLTMSRTYQGTFRSQLHSRTENRRVHRKTGTSLNVQISLDEILESFLQFSESTSDVSSAMFFAVTDAIYKRANCELPSCLPELLASIVMKGGVSWALPVAVEMCRYCVDQCCEVDGFVEAVETLKEITNFTAACGVTRLLHEEIQLRIQGNDICALGKFSLADSDEQMRDEAHEFTMIDLISAFDKLSDWDNLTIQRKKCLQNSEFTLWSDDEVFKTELDSFDFEHGPDWLLKMKLSLDSASKQDHYVWLKNLDSSQQRYFEISAITEAIEWGNINCIDDIKKLPFSINAADCLAKWSARLMTRSIYLTSLSQKSSVLSLSQSNKQSRWQELCWSEEANKRGLPRLALTCVKRNVEDLYESETLPWLYQQVRALRTLGLRQNNTEILEKALRKTGLYDLKFTIETLVTYGGDYGKAYEYSEHSTPDVVLSMTYMKLLLSNDLGLLTNEKTDYILQEIEAQNTNILEDKLYSRKCLKTMSSAYERVMSYYDDSFDTLKDETEKGTAISNMTMCMSRMHQMNLSSPSELFLAMIVHRLGECLSVDEQIIDHLFRQIEPLTEQINDFIITELRNLSRLYTTTLLQKHVKLYRKLNENDNSDKFKMCFQLVCDPAYCLLQYVKDLAESIRNKDEGGFVAAFNKMSGLFENPYAGPTYQLLSKYKTDLYEIRHFEPTDEYRKKSTPIINKVLVQLSRVEQKQSLNLSELCPALTRSLFDESEGDRSSLKRLLRLDGSLEVNRIEKQVEVYPSLRRPCIVRVLLNSGRCRRLMVKRGEPLRVDEAARCAVLALGGRGGTRERGGHYHVTALSEDCGVIEQLEDHVTLRSVINKSHDINQLAPSVRRPKDEELILASPLATLSQFNELCAAVPNYTLRSSIEKSSSSLQDFIAKKRRFTDSVAAMSIFDWVLGLGDRHLDNIMWCTVDGSACAVDWSAILQHGGLNVVPELPPARLTRLMVAVCDLQVLECRLQSILSSLRESARFILPYLRILFKWMPEYQSDEFQRKIKLTEGILKGELLSFQVTRQMLESSTGIAYAENYIELLVETFGQYATKPVYEIEEQVTCFLQQCTEPRILSVTRKGWEPWL